MILSPLKSALYLKAVGSLLQEARILLLGYFYQTCRLVKSRNRQYLSLEAQNEKNKSTLFSETLKV